MPNPPSTPEEPAPEFLVKSKDDRVQDAEKIRQEFVKSRGSQPLPANQPPPPKPTEHE